MTQLLKLIKLMNSEVEPWQLALALVFGFVFGVSPLFSLQAFLVLFLLCFLRVNISMFILAAVVSSIVGVLLSPFINELGESILLAPGLSSSWEALYQQEWTRMTRFNHTTVMGSLFISLVSCVPLFILSRVAIRNYRERVLVWVNQLHIVKLLKASEVFQLYQNIAD